MGIEMKIPSQCHEPDFQQDQRRKPSKTKKTHPHIYKSPTMETKIFISNLRKDQQPENSKTKNQRSDKRKQTKQNK